MIELAVKVKLPFLWGKAVFKKDSWTNINLIVGPNGSGKTLLAESIAKQFGEFGYSVKFLRAERDGGTFAAEAVSILRTNEAVRTKVQAVLSSMFGKSIVFRDGGADLVPVVVNRAWNVEYNLQEVECHGLKEIITLLVALYANTGNTCIVFDEPELHLHPQFQQFFADELRRVSKRHAKRMYFLITHSPFFIDLRFPEDLLGVVVCHTNREPTHIDSLEKYDEDLFRRFLPRFNTYHKQFFFSDNQIFVEGYTDQQLFTNLLPYVNTNRGIAGTGIIDVGGKDELGVFCKVCSLLGTNSRIITDLDSLFSGKLRDVFCADSRVSLWLEKQYEKQLPFFKTVFTSRELEKPITLEKLIVRLERYLAAIGRELCREDYVPPYSLSVLVEKLIALNQKHGNAENVDTFKTVVLQGVMEHGEKFGEVLAPQLAATIPRIQNLFQMVLAAAASASVYVLPRGCIEHYYTQSVVQYMPVSAKDKLFHLELEHLLSSTAEEIQHDYGELISILESSCAL
ncbi:MAG: AAA family ATPase [Treponema sp.]|nr:AAA family ATPase [Treponema sp.]